MNWFDFAVLLIIIISALFSLMRGFVREALSLAGWIAAFFISKHFYGGLATLLTNSIENALLRESVAWIALFFATLFVFGLVNFIIGRAILKAGLSGTDRMMGMVFGACRGLFIGAALVLALLFFTDFKQESWWQTSKVIPHLEVLGEWFTSHLGKDLYQNL